MTITQCVMVFLTASLLVTTVNNIRVGELDRSASASFGLCVVLTLCAFLGWPW